MPCIPVYLSTQGLNSYDYFNKGSQQSKNDQPIGDGSGWYIRQIKIVGNYAITYWLDDAVKSVMIVDIRPADR